MTTVMDRVVTLPAEEWLRRHYDKEYMSASRVAGALGYSDFEGNSPLGNYSELRGDIDRPDTTLPMELGHMLEPTVATLYERETGRPTTDPGDYAIVEHPELPWLFATLDRVTENRSGEEGALELKTTGSYNKKEWDRGEGPIEYQIQNQVQQMCAGLDWGSLAVLVGNTHFFSHDFLRNDDLAEGILKGIDAFHTRVLNGDAPDPTWQDGEVLKALHPLDNGETLIDVEATSLIRQFEEAKAEAKAADTEVEQLKNKLIARIGDHTWIQADGVRYSYKHQSRLTRASVAPEDEQRLLEEAIPFKESKSSHYRVLRKAK